MQRQIIKGCATCKKIGQNGKCLVLTRKIGLKRDCWAWSDAPDWREKIRKAAIDYEAGRGCGNACRQVSPKASPKAS